MPSLEHNLVKARIRRRKVSTLVTLFALGFSLYFFKFIFALLVTFVISLVTWGLLSESIDTMEKIIRIRQ